MYWVNMCTGLTCVLKQRNLVVVFTHGKARMGNSLYTGIRIVLQHGGSWCIFV